MRRVGARSGATRNARQAARRRDRDHLVLARLAALRVLKPAREEHLRALAALAPRAPLISILKQPSLVRPHLRKRHFRHGSRELKHTWRRPFCVRVEDLREKEEEEEDESREEY